MDQKLIHLECEKIQMIFVKKINNLKLKKIPKIKTINMNLNLLINF